tara:strand:- start:285 stop:593 length:309 start_codon:yes stop_codon:yes gene_type:complete
LQAVPNKKSYPQFIPNTIAAVALRPPGCYTTRMTKKDYQLIADTIDGLIASGSLSPHEAITVSCSFGLSLASTNPGFDPERFHAAATKSLPRMETKFEESCS